MPYQTLNLEETAAYLHLREADVEQLIRKREIPFEKRGERFVFRKGEIESWASQRILGFQDKHLAAYHKQVVDRERRFSKRELLMPDLLKEKYIDPAVTSKTKSSILRDMVRLAEKTGNLLDASGLLDGLQDREKLCSTGMPRGLALLHPRYQRPYLFQEDMVLMGRTIQGIPFGAPDGSSTGLFFLLCCRTDSLHLHVLARICMMARETDLLDRLRETEDAAVMLQSVLTAEAELLKEM